MMMNHEFMELDRRQKNIFCFDVGIEHKFLNNSNLSFKMSAKEHHRGNTQYLIHKTNSN